MLQNYPKIPLDDDDQNSLKCRNCHRMVHYECTQLPLYQLQIFANTYNDQYLCQNCVRITRSLMSKVGENSYHMMQKEIEKKDDVIKKLKIQLAKNRSLKDDIESILTKKMTDFEIKTKQMIKEEIKQTTKYIEKTSEKTYAEITKNNKENFKSAVKEHQQEKMNEEKDIESRNRNIIIHGIVESMVDTKEEEEEQDRKDIEEILRTIGAQDIKPTTHHRIGQKNEEKMPWRPIKLILKSTNEKERIMKNLHKLGHKLKSLDHHLGLSITDDFTINERKMIKDMCQKAKKMNSENDGDFVWRVRGSPRTSLRLVRKPRKLTDILSDDWTTDED